MGTVKATARSKDSLQKWQVAVHNHAVQLRDEQMALEWDQRLRDGASAAASIPLRHVSRTVAESLLGPENSVFRWCHSRWTILCPDPACIETVPRLPKQADRVRAHFQKHGIPVVNNHDVLALFGCQGMQSLHILHADLLMCMQWSGTFQDGMMSA